MTLLFSRYINSALPMKRRRPTESSRLRFEELEGRIAPALFSVLSPVALGNTKNFGSMASGDFNGDGKTDIVMTNYGTAAPGASPPNNAGGNTISILIGNGDGTFKSPNTITIGSDQYVSFVAVGDLNGDHKQDLAVVSNNEDASGELRIYLGNGSGGFTLSPQGAIPTGSFNACWVGIAQVTNGDTDPDVVVCGFGASNADQSAIVGNNITVYQGDGTGAVNLINTVAIDDSFIPTSLALADFDGDGNMDIAATVPGVPPDSTDPQPDGTVQLFSGNGSGDFTTGNSFDSGGALPISIQAAYLDGDNLPDLVVANAGDPDADNLYQNFGTNSSIGVLMNSGDLNFNTNTLTAGLGVSGSKSVFAVATSDFNLDGKQDIAAIVYGNPLSGANARVLEYKGDGQGGFAADAGSPYNTNATDGQYLVAAPIDANASPDIVYSTDNGHYGVLTNNTVVAPTVTINQGASQADPTNSDSIVFDVNFSEPVTGFGDVPGDVDLSGSTNGGVGLNAVVSAIDSTHYTVTVTGMDSIGTGFVKATIPAGAAQAISDNTNSVASTSTDNKVTFDLVAPSVTINQASGQADPATTGPILFTVVFSESVSGFTGSDISFSGSTVGGTLQAAVSGSGQNYTVSVTGMNSSGIVMASIPAGAAFDTVGNASNASTSNDNQVTFGSATPPAVTINQDSGQADPTNLSPITFDVHFDQPVTGFTGSDVSFSGSTVGGNPQAEVSGSGQDYFVTVTGMSGQGTVVASIPADSAFNSLNTGNSASTSTDNSVTFDDASPSVTINQGANQSDPTNIPSIDFDVKFSEPVTGFDKSDVSLAGSTVGGTLTVAVTGSLDTYVVTVTGMTTRGSVIATIPLAGAAQDAVGNQSLPSTSTDNSVEFLHTGTIGFTQAVYNTAELDHAINSVTITVSRTGETEGAVAIHYGMIDGTAHSGGSSVNGQADYKNTGGGTLSWGDGEGGDKTFTISILPDDFNEGQENINLVLTPLYGSPGIGLDNAIAAIAPSDGKTGTATYLDTDGDKYTIRLLGSKTGSMVSYQSDPDGTFQGPIYSIVLTGTQPNPLKPTASLVISVKKAKTSTDGGTVGIGAIIGAGDGSGLKSISARKVNLDPSITPDGIDQGIDMQAYLGSLTIGNVLNGARITTLATTNPKQKTRINALAIGDGAVIDIGAGVSGLIATSFGASTFTAPSLSAMRIIGAVTGGDFTIAGNVGNVVVGAFRDSLLSAGYTGADDGTGTFNSASTVNLFRSTSKTDGFENSRVIATNIRSALIRSLDSNNSGNQFGFYADGSIGKVRVVGPTAFQYDASLLGPPFLADFWVMIV
jgi:FG-GAP-like repeat/Calx-beta domain/Bacterial Ig-like domain